MNLTEVYEKFPTQKECVEFLENIRWKGEPVCPYCQSKKNHPTPAELRYFCHTCKTSYGVKIGTILDGTRLPLQKWFCATSLILNSKRKISSRQFARDLGVTKDTAWSMQAKIRSAMIDAPSLLMGIAEIDGP